MLGPLLRPQRDFSLSSVRTRRPTAKSLLPNGTDLPHVFGAFCERAEAVAEDSRESKDSSSATRAAINEQRLSQPVRFFSLRDEITLLAEFGWTLFLRVNSGVIPMRRRLPTEDASERRPANSPSMPGVVDGLPAL